MEIELKNISTADLEKGISIRVATSAETVRRCAEAIHKKKSAIVKIIKRHPEESLRVLAERCGVSKTTIHRYIQRLVHMDQLQRPEKIVGIDGREYPAQKPKPVFPNGKPAHCKQYPAKRKKSVIENSRTEADPATPHKEIFLLLQMKQR